jgi:drug/metabolite transporter (DMT)-like permease
MVKIFPFIFILLWSSAFITTKPIIDNSDPFAALAFRFALVAFGFFLFSLYSKEKILVRKKNFFESFFSGVLFHGFYLGGVFYSISIGMPTGIAALIVTLQPILTNALSGPILNEKVSTQQWVGVLLGFVGAALVLGFDIGSKIPTAGLVATIIALVAITFSTLWQKKLSNNLPLSVSNTYQALGGCVFHLLIIFLFVDPYIDFTQTFLIAMSHQIILVSFGAFTILMYLIKNNSASKTVSIFF